MFDLDKWSEILQTLLRNKARSLLTAFGVFWGVFLLVLLMGGTQGFRQLMERNFDGFSQNALLVFSRETSRPHKGFQTGRHWSMTNSDVPLLRRRVAGVQVVTPLLMRYGTYSYKEKQGDGPVKGVYPNYTEVENPKIAQGRFIRDTDIAQYRKVCVIGKEVAATLFPSGESPLGRFISVRGVYFQVVGVSMNESNMSIGGQSTKSVLVPFTTLQRLDNRGLDIDFLAVTARSGHTISALQPQIERLLRETHHLHPDDKQALVGINLEAMFQMVQSLFRAIRFLVWLIGLGTLLSGAIGVSNIMMVVVKERTTEIGIRRAIGARPASILMQILAESMVLTVVAGLSGIVLAVLILAAIEAGVGASSPGSVPPNFQIPFLLTLGAAALLSLLGITAGIAPALRALAVKPIEAIRDE